MTARYLQTPAIHAPLRPGIFETFNQVPAVCFTLTLLSDIAYWQTENLMWHNFSSWLLFAGLVGGGFAAVALAIDFVRRRRFGLDLNPLFPLGAMLAWLLALLNSFVHAGDGWTAIVPWGLVLSAVVVLLMLGLLFLGGPFRYPDQE